MSRGVDIDHRSLEGVLIAVAERLRGRRTEIEEAITARARGVAGLTWDGDTEIHAGRQSAVAALIDYGLASLVSQDWCAAPAPAALIEQVHRMARGGIGLDTVLLSCIAAQGIFGEFVMAEAEAREDPREDSVMPKLRISQKQLLEHITTTIAHEYHEESERLVRSVDERRRSLVRRLIAGELVDATELDYNFDGWHLGLIATGTDARRALRELTARSDRPALVVPFDEATVWAWLAGHRRGALPDLARPGAFSDSCSVSLVVGEPASGIAGWRLTHEEAQAGLRVALRKPKQITRCVDVLLEAAVLRDDVLAKSLMAHYLAPLDNMRIGGGVSRETIRAYCDCQRNVSSTAHRLGVTRKTVESRLREIETAIGHTLPGCLPELEVALRLESMPALTA